MRRTRVESGYRPDVVYYYIYYSLLCQKMQALPRYELILNIEQILKERGISKNRICKDLDIPRPNFNRYCRGDFQRIDAALVCKLCWYLKIDAGELIEYMPPE